MVEWLVAAGLTGHVGGMAPNHRPANENGEPDQEPGLFSTRQRAIESTLSLLGLAALWGAAALWLDASHWWSVSITLAFAFVCMVVAALYRLVVHGRA